MMKNSNTINDTAKDSLEILVFSTSIQNNKDVEAIKGVLENLRGILSWNIDLEDWEKVLRIESVGVQAYDVIELILEKGVFICEL